MLKKLPLPISGLMLGIAGAGNLIQNYSEEVRLAFGAVAAIIFVMLTLKILLHFEDFKNEMKNPIIASVIPTYSMTGMLLAGYIKPFIGNAANILWYLSVVIHVCLIIYFTITFVLNFNLEKVFPSWFIVYVGIVISTVTAKAFNPLVGKISFWFGLISYIILLPIIYKRVTTIELPNPAKPLLAIFAAPGSLLITGYINLFDNKNIYFAIILLLIAQIIYLLVILNMPKLLKLGFYPSYSGFTFPLVISAIGLKVSNVYLISVEKGLGILKYLVLLETIIAVCIVVYVFIKYIQFLTKKDKAI